MVLVVFKTMARVLRGFGGGFDSHTLPPHLSDLSEVTKKRGGKRRHLSAERRFRELILGGAGDNRLLRTETTGRAELARLPSKSPKSSIAERPRTPLLRILPALLDATRRVALPLPRRHRIAQDVFQ